MNRPSFFIVGAANCGTTALSECLHQHPGVFLPQAEEPERYWLGKEPFQFGVDLGIAEWLRTVNDGEYLDYFKSAPDNAVCGTPVPWKLFLEEAPAHIKEFEPDAKVVIMLCPPVTWMRSWHHDLLRYAYEDQVDFGQALALEEERAEGRKIPRQAASEECLQYRKAAHFSEQVERYFEAFGQENVFVGLLEDLQSEPQVFLNGLLKFLEVDSSVELDAKQENAPVVLKGTHHFDLAVARVLGRLPGGVGLKSFFRKNLEKRYRRLADRIFAPMSDKTINSILEEELLEEFEPEVAKLGKLIGRDLSHWNEPRFPRSEDGHHHH